MPRVPRRVPRAGIPIRASLALPAAEGDAADEGETREESQMRKDRGPELAGIGYELTRVTDPTSVVDDVLSALADSAARLRRAANVVEDEAATSELARMADRRSLGGSRIIEAAVGAGMRRPKGYGGTVGGALRRGWIRLEAALSGDDEVIETVAHEESQVAQMLERAIDGVLPSEVDEAIRTVWSEISDDTKLLKRLGR
jgi:hypothetical protein